MDYLIALTFITGKEMEWLEFSENEGLRKVRSRALFIVTMNILHKSFQVQWSRFRAPWWWLHAYQLGHTVSP